MVCWHNYAFSTVAQLHRLPATWQPDFYRDWTFTSEQTMTFQDTSRGVRRYPCQSGHLDYLLHSQEPLSRLGNWNLRAGSRNISVTQFNRWLPALSCYSWLIHFWTWGGLPSCTALLTNHL